MSTHIAAVVQLIQSSSLCSQLNIEHFSFIPIKRSNNLFVQSTYRGQSLRLFDRIHHILAEELSCSANQGGSSGDGMVILDDLVGFADEIEAEN